MVNNSCIIFCKCGAGVIHENKFDWLATNLKNLGTDVFELHDLCAFSLHEKELLANLGKNYQKKFVVACYPRAIKNMFKQNGVEFGEFEVLNFKELTQEHLVSKLENDFHIPKGEARYKVKHSELEVPAWYPVIDGSLCTLCGKCAHFCLFGVYNFDKKSLKVLNPLSCKNLCPACGRTCPSSAIMFPRLAEKSTLAGDEPGIKIAEPEKGSLLMQLNNRNLNRKTIFRKDVVLQAEEEREKALREIKMSMKNKG